MKNSNLTLVSLVLTLILSGCGSSGDSGGDIEISPPSSTNTTLATTDDTPIVETTPVEVSKEDTSTAGDISISTGTDTGTNTSSTGNSDTTGTTTNGTTTTGTTTNNTVPSVSVTSIPFPTLPTDINLNHKYIPPQI